MIASSGLSQLECTRFVFGRGSTPDFAGEAHSAPGPQVPSWLNSGRPYFEGGRMGREGKKRDRTEMESEIYRGWIESQARKGNESNSINSSTPHTLLLYFTAVDGLNDMFRPLNLQSHRPMTKFRKARYQLSTSMSSTTIYSVFQKK